MSRAAAWLPAVLATAALVALSRAPYRTDRGDAALLRLSWSGRPERIERCREVSAAEQAGRPAHMRRRLECEGRPARYAVLVRTGGRTAGPDTVTGSGLRGDRPIHMLRDYELAPGPRRITVEVTRLETIEEDRGEAKEPDEEAAPGTLALDRTVRERQERRRQRQEALPPSLRLDTSVVLAPGGVVVITYDHAARRLVALTAGR